MKIARRTAAPQPDRQQAILWIHALTGELHVVTPDGTDTVVGGAGGGGTSDHAALLHLGWGTSGHTGAANRIAYFGGGGATDYLSVGTGLSVSGAALVVDTGTIATVASVAAGYQPLNASLTAISGGTWAGATSITTLGTVGTGVWQGTTIATAYGGTGIGTYTVGQMLYASGVSTLSPLNIGTAGYFLVSTGSAPVWAAPGDLTVSAGAVQVTKARGLRDSGGTTYPMGTLREGEFLKLSGGVLTTAAVNSAILISAAGGMDLLDWGPYTSTVPDIVTISAGSDV